MNKFLGGLLLFAVFFVTGCSEVKEGADAVSGKITGEQDIQTMKKTEKKLKMLQNKTNKQQQDALDSLEN